MCVVLLGAFAIASVTWAANNTPANPQAAQAVTAGTTLDVNVMCNATATPVAVTKKNVGEVVVREDQANNEVNKIVGNAPDWATTTVTTAAATKPLVSLVVANAAIEKNAVSAGAVEGNNLNAVAGIFPADARTQGNIGTNAGTASSAKNQKKGTNANAWGPTARNGVINTSAQIDQINGASSPI